jgi:hypothetical protein
MCSRAASIVGARLRRERRPPVALALDAARPVRRATTTSDLFHARGEPEESLRAHDPSPRSRRRTRRGARDERACALGTRSCVMPYASVSGVCTPSISRCQPAVVLRASRRTARCRVRRHSDAPEARARTRRAPGFKCARTALEAPHLFFAHEVGLADHEHVGELDLLDQQIDERALVLVAAARSRAAQVVGRLVVAQERLRVDHRHHRVELRHVGQREALLVAEARTWPRPAWAPRCPSTRSTVHRSGPPWPAA